jgi:hypothetical protein
LQLSADVNEFARRDALLACEPPLGAPGNLQQVSKAPSGDQPVRRSPQALQ